MVGISPTCLSTLGILARIETILGAVAKELRQVHVGNLVAFLLAIKVNTWLACRNF